MWLLLSLFLKHLHISVQRFRSVRWLQATCLELLPCAIYYNAHLLIDHDSCWDCLRNIRIRTSLWCHFGYDSRFYYSSRREGGGRDNSIFSIHNHIGSNFEQKLPQQSLHFGPSVWVGYLGHCARQNTLLVSNWFHIAAHTRQHLLHPSVLGAQYHHLTHVCYTLENLRQWSGGSRRKAFCLTTILHASMASTCVHARGLWCIVVLCVCDVYSRSTARATNDTGGILLGFSDLATHVIEKHAQSVVCYV